MVKKIISIILIFIILALWMPMQAFVDVFTSYAVDTTWEFNYSGTIQNFNVPYKGIYKIEAYGAKGGTANNNVIGGNGSYISGTILFNKNDQLTVTVGGQNGYNGGGAGNSIYGTGGGASDIRLNGTAITNRILVASGGGGSYATPNYHNHSSGCYTTKTGYRVEKRPRTCGCMSGNSGNGSGSACSACTHDGGHPNPCQVVTGYDEVTVPYTYQELTCGRTAGVTIDSYTYINGKSEVGSNGTLHQGSTGGGGGYYGGNPQYAGTNYTSEEFSEVTTTVGKGSGNGYIKITLLKSYADVELTETPTSWTNQNATITVKAKDEVIGLKEVPYSWQDGERTTSTTYIAETNGTYKVNVINNYDLEEEQTITINNIDKIEPVINNIEQVISTDKKQTTLTINGTDTGNELYAASGIVGYAITRTNTPPTNKEEFYETNQFIVNQNGIYYAWAIDAAGNISKITGTGGSEGIGSTILVKDIEIDILGTITWNDENNNYNTRVNTEVSLYKKIGNGAESLVSSQNIIAGQTSYKFQTRETNDNGEYYTFRIEERLMDGYDNVYSQNNVTNTETKNIEINISNDLILPEYTSKIEITPVNAPSTDTILKNSEVKIRIEIAANSNNRGSVGVHSGMAVINLDEKINLDRNSITLIYEDGQGNKTYIGNDYTLWRNRITTYVGSTEQGISMAGGKLIIEMDAVMGDIGEYQSDIAFTGKLRDLRGKNTNIDLGTILQQTRNDSVKYQIPTANIRLKNVDSITEQILTDATFALYEWNGTEYIKKEVITDENQDGIYESQTYRWNTITQGKYKIVEEGIPNYHKDLDVSMEYTLEEYHETDYTVTVDYDKYVIKYGKRDPDNLDRLKGIVENEPWKLKASIEKIDMDTKNIIQSEAEFEIYEWNNQTNQYEQYTSYTKDTDVNMTRLEDKSYLTDEWLYYTAKNEGKYRIIETKAPEGYYANYEENGEKVTYDINLTQSIQTGEYKGQTVENESTIKITNTEQNKVTNKRVNATLNVILADKETLDGSPQADATLEGAKYGIYALEQINHADGVTTRYENEPGIIYKKDELIETQTTNNERKLTFENLECGKYYIKMIEAPEGYILDETKYKIDFSYQGEEKEHLELTGKIEINVKKQAFQLYKLKENQEILSNAGFSIYLINDLSIIKENKIIRATKDTYYLNDEEAKQSNRLKEKQNEDGTYYLYDLIDYYYQIDYTEENKNTLPGDNEVYHPYKIEENLVKDYSNNSEGNNIEEIRTDSKGYMQSPKLAYGEYIVLETSVPRQQQVVKGFIVKVEEDSNEAQELRFVIDKDFKTKVKIYTKDSSTKNTIENKKSYYVIKNEETGKYMTKNRLNGLKVVEQGTIENPFETKNEGYFITPMELPIGKYILEEVKAPEGYVINGKEGYAQEKETIWTPKEKIKFEIASNSIYYMDHHLGNYIIVLEQENEEALGSLIIKAEGEYLNKAEEKQDKNYEFTYTSRPVPNIEYEIYAAEDINSQDNKKVQRYKKDEKITTVTTDENGEVIVPNLPQGKYYIKETQAGYGFTTKQEKQQVEITYEGQEIPVIFKTLQSREERKTVDITIKNVDEQTKEKTEGGTYGIYNKEEITYTTEEGETKTIPAGTLLYTTQPNEEGEIKFSKEINVDLPIGDYIVKELTPPKGHIKEDKEPEEIEISLNKTGGEQEKVVITKEKQRTRTKLNIEFKDGEKLIKNIELSIKDKQTGDIIASTKEKENTIKIEKREDGYYVEKLPIGEYMLVQEEIPYEEGYVEKIEQSITVQDTLELQTIEIKQEISKLEIKIKDQETNKPLLEENTIIQIQDKEGNIVASNTKQKENTLKIEQTEECYYLERLPVTGEYKLLEITPNGYKSIEEQTLEIKDTKEKQEINLTTRKLIFDVGIEKKLKNIIINGQKTNAEKNEELMKVEVKERKIPTIKLELEYSVTVVNKGETQATVEKIIDKIPQGLIYQEKGSSNWKLNKQEATYEEKIMLNPGESKELKMTLKWDNNITNFGEKKNTASIEKVSNPYGYENSNKAKGAGSASIVISVGTGVEEKVTIIRIIIIALTTCMVICLIAGIEILILKRKK